MKHFIAKGLTIILAAVLGFNCLACIGGSNSQSMTQTQQSATSAPTAQAQATNAPAEKDPTAETEAPADPFDAAEVAAYKAYTRADWDAENWDAKEPFTQMIGDVIIFSGHGVDAKMYWKADLYTDHTMRIYQNQGVGAVNGIYYGYFAEGPDPDPEFANDYTALYITYLNDVLAVNHPEGNYPTNLVQTIATEITTDAGTGYTATMSFTGDYDDNGNKNYDVTLATHSSGILTDEGWGELFTDPLANQPEETEAEDADYAYYFEGIETIASGDTRYIKLYLYADNSLKLERWYQDVFMLTEYEGAWKALDGDALEITIYDSGKPSVNVVEKSGDGYAFTWNRIDAERESGFSEIELSTVNK